MPLFLHNLRVHALLLSLLGALGSGCASTPDTNPLRGHALDLRITDPSANRYVLYQLDRQGELTYYAGNENTPLWRGPLAEHDLNLIGNLLHVTPAPLQLDPIKGQDAYELHVSRRGQIFDTHLTSGPTSFLADLADLLKNAQLSARGMTPTSTPTAPTPSSSPSSLSPNP
ncbi:MAG: hypothetical protein H7Y88_08335 [Phycisphaerales bacterium]|nr:hypothetical protein [Phycisphaerales bacterium]